MYDYRLFFSNPPSGEPVRRMPPARSEPLRVHRLPGREPRDRRVTR